MDTAKNMTKSQTAYDVVPFPPLQHQLMDWLELMRRRHTMYALIEVDVTDARRAVRDYRARTGAPLSLTAFLIACFARAIDQDRAMQAYRLGRRHLVLFADVDVTNMVERIVDGQRIPVPHIIRAANRKSRGEIQREIQAAQGETRPYAVAARSLPHRLQAAAMRQLPLWLVLPARLRRLAWAWLLRDPHRRKRLTGTVSVTSVAMFGHGRAWGISPSDYTLGLLIGGLSTKPGVVGEQIAPREFMCLTLSLDHDVIDGAPAARFIKRLTDLIESGAGLHDEKCNGLAAHS